ncbi:putative efflux protein, MATE family [Lachnospiraceae bacterium RM5]|nr:putative efflux protein, MATE family [Lachnospiraceae bacterium RM5]
MSFFKATDTNVSERSVFSLAWPIFVQTFLSILLGYIDTLMTSRYSVIAVGGIGNANQIISFLALAFSIISTATTIVISWMLGAKKDKEINVIYTLSIYFNLFLSVFISLLILIFHRNIIALMNVQKAMVKPATDYIIIVGGFIFFNSLFYVYGAIFTSNGHTTIIMIISILMNFINIIGNYCFLYGPLSFLNLGVKGVAISTVTSSIISVIISIIYFNTHISGNISIKYLFPFPLKMLKLLLKVGLPAAGENISYNIAQLCILRFVNTISIVAVNTRIYANIFTSFSFVFSIATSGAISIIVGHLVGAKRYDDAYKRVLKVLYVSFIFAVILASINFLLSPLTFSIFTKDKSVIALGRKIMFIGIFLEMGRCINLVVIKSLRSAGDIKFPTYLGMASMWGISVLFSYILGLKLNMGLIGIWIALAADEIVRGIIVYIRWIKKIWVQKAKIVESDEFKFEDY